MGRVVVGEVMVVYLFEIKGLDKLWFNRQLIIQGIYGFIYFENQLEQDSFGFNLDSV